MEVKKYDKIVLDSSRSIDDIAAGIKAELSKQESQNAGESYICYVSHAYSSGDNAGVNYIVVSDEFKNLNGLSSNVIKASAYTKDEINELIARVEAKIPVDEANLATKEEINEINSTITDAINTKANADAVVNLTDNQTIDGVKTFSAVPVVATQPTDDNQVANKAYVDGINTTLTGSINTKANANATVNLTSDQTIEGVKTFSAPIVVPNATANTHAVNLAQLNTKANADAVVNLTGDQTIDGVKTFSMVPVCATAPTNANQLANKAYVDSRAVSGGSGDVTKASWGVNWNAEVHINESSDFYAPSDGLVFVWGKKYLPDPMTRPSAPYNRTHGLYFLPKMYSGGGNDFFPDSVDGGPMSIDGGESLQFYPYYSVNDSKGAGGEGYTSTLSVIPVRQGDRIWIFNTIKSTFDNYNWHHLHGVFFPFEK